MIYSTAIDRRFTELGHSARAARHARHASAFTLVEILIVVVILGILATIVLPQFSNATDSARQNTLKDELRYLRTQILVYKAQHNDTPPGAGSADFVTQMTSFTDALGNTSPTASQVYRFGPYLTQMPSNPISGLSTVDIVTTSPLAADGTHGWVYNPTTLEIIADLAGSDSNGTAYLTY
jgi:general secretion pathway protein G